MEIKWQPGDLAWWESTDGERFAVEVMGAEYRLGMQMVSFRLDEPMWIRLVRMVVLFRNPRRNIYRMPGHQFQPRNL